MAESALMVKSKAFALEVIRACRVLREAKCEGALISQFLRSGTSIGANIHEAFYAQGDTLAADRRINSLMRPKITDALKGKNVTRYRLCKDLGLNLGNVYAYLAGDDTKVSKATARRMLNYLQG